jgi:phage replication O-like protein O
VGIKSPNFTQVPNELFDDWIRELGFAEVKVLMIIMRKTFGWHKVRDRISLSQLETLTGLTRSNIIKATKTLIKKRFITKEVEGKLGSQATYYELVVEDVKESSNGYLCDTGGSIFAIPGGSIAAIPTKETYTKEKDITAASPAATPPVEIFRYNSPESGKTRVTMPKDQYNKLVTKHGEEKILDYCERLDQWADTNPKGFNRSACHSGVIRSWIARDDKNNPPAAQKPKEKHNPLLTVMDQYDIESRYQSKVEYGRIKFYSSNGYEQGNFASEDEAGIRKFLESKDVKKKKA